MKTFEPTDYMQINDKEKWLNHESYKVIYNESQDAVVTFKSDRFFNKKGFLLYFNGNYQFFFMKNLII